MKRELLEKVIKKAEKEGKKCVIITNIIESNGGYSSSNFDIMVSNYIDRYEEIKIKRKFLDDNILYISQEKFESEKKKPCDYVNVRHIFDAEYYINLDDIKSVICYKDR